MNPHYYWCIWKIVSYFVSTYVMLNMNYIETLIFYVFYVVNYRNINIYKLFDKTR
ncbi:hypothetical protein SDC9_144435 [bioreactor metagenome]|uniref:Uncharacterized protein n=1 Tax=bioreactor metagenome TaxID=1076179 RepID=A0A645E9F3_9ZZZZ